MQKDDRWIGWSYRGGNDSRLVLISQLTLSPGPNGPIYILTTWLLALLQSSFIWTFMYIFAVSFIILFHVFIYFLLLLFQECPHFITFIIHVMFIWKIVWVQYVKCVVKIEDGRSPGFSFGERWGTLTQDSASLFRSLVWPARKLFSFHKVNSRES